MNVYYHLPQITLPNSTDEHGFITGKKTKTAYKCARQEIPHIWSLNIFRSTLIKIIFLKGRKIYPPKKRALEKWVFRDLLTKKKKKRKTTKVLELERKYTLEENHRTFNYKSPRYMKAKRLISEKVKPTVRRLKSDMVSLYESDSWLGMGENESQRCKVMSCILSTSQFTKHLHMLVSSFSFDLYNILMSETEQILASLF